MSTFNLNGATVGNALASLLTAQDIQPGDEPSYQICKTLYACHPLGAKLADTPIEIAQSQARTITVPKGPEERLVEAFLQEWKAIGADKHIFNTARLARVYGVASLALLSEGTPPDRPMDYKGLYDAEIGFNVFDPLNTAGSLVLNQDPNSPTYQKVGGISVAGQPYHRSRAVTLMNEDPLYIEYTSSAFGYVGRSVYQRALFPLKSYINTQITNDLVAVKAGVLVAKMQQQSSVIDNMMANISGQKRSLAKEAASGNVLSIGTDEAIESMDLKNLEGPFNAARRNIIVDIASSSGTPAKLLLEETFAEGFGEGSEDAKHIAKYVARIREWMDPLYDFFDKIVRHRAWNPEFFKTIQEQFPEEYGKKTYTQAFYQWTNSFHAEWPNLLEEPDSEKSKVEDVKLKAIIAMLEVLLPEADPENKATIIQWACDNFNSFKILFSSPLLLDMDALKNFVPPTPLEEPAPGKPFAAADSARRLAVAR